MSYEHTSLETGQDFNRLDVTIEQRPLSGWAVVAHLSTFVVVPLAFGLGVPFVGLPWFLLAIAFFVVGLSWKRRVSFHITATELIVDAWVGFVGRPAHVALPLVGLRTKHKTSASINKRQVYRLELFPEGGEVVSIGALACTGDDLRRLDTLLRQAEGEARMALGEGTAEVPGELREIVAEHVPAE